MAKQKRNWIEHISPGTNADPGMVTNVTKWGSVGETIVDITMQDLQDHHLSGLVHYHWVKLRDFPVDFDQTATCAMERNSSSEKGGRSLNDVSLAIIAPHHDDIKVSVTACMVWPSECSAELLYQGNLTNVGDNCTKWILIKEGDSSDLERRLTLQKGAVSFVSGIDNPFYYLVWGVTIVMLEMRWPPES